MNHLESKLVSHKGWSLRVSKRSVFRTILIISFVLIFALIVRSSNDKTVLTSINNRNLDPKQCVLHPKYPPKFGAKNDYFLPKGYRVNPPRYFNDLNATDLLYQTDIYNFAAHFASLPESSTLIDIGSGTGYKSAYIYNNVTAVKNFVVLDFGPNLDIARSNYMKTKRYQKQQHVQDVQFHEWDIDQHPIPSAIQGQLIRDATIVVADVIEHLINPDTLIDKLISVLKGCKPKSMIISTPDRAGYGDQRQFGPPDNIYHIREWSLNELKRYLESRGAPVRECISAWSHNKARELKHDKYTTACLISEDRSLRFPNVEEIKDYFPFTRT